MRFRRGEEADIPWFDSALSGDQKEAVSLFQRAGRLVGPSF